MVATMTDNVATLPPRDPIFALAPELKLHLSEIDGALVVNSREVARVFGTKHPRLLRRLARCIEVCNRKGSGSWYRQRADGTVDMISEGLIMVVGGARISKRAKQFIFDWIDLFGARAREYEARTGRSLDGAIAKAIGVPFHYFTPDGRQCCDDCRLAKNGGPMLHDELWHSIAPNSDPDTFLCFECTEKRLGRGLTQADLKRCPFNAGWISFDGADVAALEFARGRQLLPP
jgi:hypothetical protein